MKITIGRFSFHRTCSTCPEQYDIYDETGAKVAYARLRYGHFVCAMPDIMGVPVFACVIGDDWTGEFLSDRQRRAVLKDCATAIEMGCQYEA